MTHVRWTVFVPLIVLVLALVAPVAAEQRMFGVVIAVVTDNKDPDKMYRVKVKFPFLPSQRSDEEVWARVMVPFTGRESGFFSLPEKDDEVLVAFEHGDPHRPVIIGGIWNGEPPAPPTQE